MSIEIIPKQKQKINIFKPTIVGVPTVNPHNGLFKCSDGEIRHYADDGFLYSKNNGLTWLFKSFSDDESLTGRRPLAVNPKTGTALRMVSGGSGTSIYRSVGGSDGSYYRKKISDVIISNVMIRPAYFLPSGKAVLFAGQTTQRPYQIAIFRSVDDGITWTTTVLPHGPAFEVTPPHLGTRWQNWCLEPTIVELNDGRVWLLARTSQDEHYECFSNDAGVTWSEWQPSRFYGTLTMPTLLRLEDGRIVLFWSNSTPLPEIDLANASVSESVKEGLFEDVFTNRDVYHAAISEDDGNTWIGFREVRLNPYRNASNYGDMATADFSVHQGQALELPDNKILVAHGQDEKIRALVIFDVDWLYETRRKSSFENDLDDWSTFKYIKGIVGHCTYNRVDGAKLISHPDKSNAQVLQIQHSIDNNLVFDKDGAVWNFPAAIDGIFTTRIKLIPGGGGAQICLIDRWFNPTDPVVADYAMYVLKIPGDGNLGNNITLTPGQWYDLTFSWNNSQSSDCKLSIDGTLVDLKLPNIRPSINGISYVHFQALSENEDLKGFLIESVEGGKK
ncbi:MAG: sialidase family protein [Paludibacter sp.]|nr:sialidase family protein [Paludibacter sp.]